MGLLLQTEIAYRKEFYESGIILYRHSSSDSYRTKLRMIYHKQKKPVSYWTQPA